ncbi:MAG: zinc ABC transporter substrate-binding protein [Sporomusaceae bacterium]|nr:zinc ABC transporter substrate-binding protein [Sporomusaceae bacterium]
MSKPFRLAGVLLALAALLLTAACGSPAAPAQRGGKLTVVATTTMLTDLAKEIGGDYADVQGLMGAGIDPHLYKPSAGDVKKMSGARLIIYNGLHLEGKMGDVFEQMKKNGIATLAAAEAVDRAKLLESADFDGNYDPHVWFNVELWIDAAAAVKQAMIAADPAHQTAYEQNAARYIEKLRDVHAYVQTEAARVPAQSRVLITAHDAFGYFGKTYGFEVKGLQGISTAAEAGAADVRELAAFIADHRIAAIFIESSVPKRSIEALQEAVKARGYEVGIGGELFSDSLGEAGKPEGTYIGTIRHNIDTIVKALAGKTP